jgi:hypothetical protein
MTNLINQINNQYGYERVAKLGNGYPKNKYGILDRQGIVIQVITAKKLKEINNEN